MDLSPGIPRRWIVVVVFLVSLVAITAELFFGVMVGLKAFSHMVYVSISFALLGYGIGANLQILLQERLAKRSPAGILVVTLALIAATVALSAHVLPSLPVRLSMILSPGGIGGMAALYITVALPFVGIGFLISHLFTENSADSGRLYFWDLVGAGVGAALFFPLISTCGPIRGLALLAGALMALAAAVAAVAGGALKKAAWIPGLATVGLFACVFLPEPDYVVDENMGWENIPKSFPADKYRTVARRWSPMGRTDLYELLDPKFRPSRMVPGMRGVLGIAFKPDPDLSYFTTNYRAGTPVHALSAQARLSTGSRSAPYSESMELPYILLQEPRVLVIGAGGGRDLHMAKVHGASAVVAAEINPVTFDAMSPGGAAFEYSGGIYAAPGVQVHNTDGRHLAAVQPSGSYDLLILNGIDTFAALSTGAFAYAENYLYTREALLEYLRVLKPGGVLNMNRWFELSTPRESLRLFIMVLDALTRFGVKEPLRHITLGRYGTGEIQWGMMMVKPTPYTDEEYARIEAYYAQFGIDRIFPAREPRPGEGLSPFGVAASAFHQGRIGEYIDDYWADISVVKDDSPFFYKYYRFSILPDVKGFHPAGGTPAFQAQVLILIQTILFIALFIYVPLVWSRRKQTESIVPGGRLPFVLFFSGIGMGYILTEIALMQRFTLMLGSPLHAISVTLAALLVASGLGSRYSGKLQGNPARRIGLLTLAGVAYLLAFAFGGTGLLGFAVAWPLGLRLALCVALVAPPGFILGMYFPTALTLVGSRAPSAVAWAWGINSGFTVLGSTLSIMIAQFTGFTVVLLVACACYILAALAFALLHRKLTRAESAGAPPITA